MMPLSFFLCLYLFCFLVVFVVVIVIIVITKMNLLIAWSFLEAFVSLAVHISVLSVGMNNFVIFSNFFVVACTSGIFLWQLWRLYHVVVKLIKLLH